MESPRNALVTWIGRMGIALGLLLSLAGPPPSLAQAPSDWRGGAGPVAFVTHIAADPRDSDFLLIFVANSARRNPDQTQTAQGQITPTWAPYFSVDGGESWQPASNDLAEIHPTTLQLLADDTGVVAWVGSETQGLWRSDNRGRTWRPAPIPELVNQRVVGIAQDARGRLHVLTVDANRYPATHLYASRDGRRWSHRQIQAYQDAPQAAVAGILADPFDANRLYITTFGGLLITQDAGFTWRRIHLPLPEGAEPVGRVLLTADATQRGRLFLVWRGKVDADRYALLSFRSLDGGLTWQPLPTRLIPSPGGHPQALPIPFTLRLDPRTREGLLMATSAGLWRSPDGGVTWLMAGADLAGAGVLDVLPHPRRKGAWIAIGAGGVWRTETGGASWRPSVQGLPATAHIRALAQLAGPRGASLALNGGFLPQDDLTHPLWRSVDGGERWTLAMRGLEGARVRQLIAHPALPNTAFALTETGIARTDNGGRTWLQRDLAGYPLSIAADPTGPRVYVGLGQGLLFSPDGGDAWRQTFAGGSVVAVTVDAAGRPFLAAYGDDGALTLWRGQANGEGWRMVGPLPVQDAVTLQAHPQQPNLLTLIAPWQGLWVTVDGGARWERRDASVPAPTHWRGGAAERPDAPNLLALFMDPETGAWWAGRDGGGVYYSLNNGARWQDASGDMGDALILSFAHSSQGLLAGSANGGVFHHSQSLDALAPPPQVDVRIEIFWPHAFAPVAAAERANLGLRLYRTRSLEPPPCAWTPNVDVWEARDAEPLRRLGLAHQRNVDGRPFPFWVMNDIDVTWAQDPDHQLIYLARVAPGLAESRSSVWVHAADARTRQPQPPQPQGLAPTGVTELDGRILVVWPHDDMGRYAPPDEAPLANITAALFQRQTLLTLRPEDLPQRVWLIGALDNQIGRRLAVGTPRQAEVNGLRYTLYDFNDIDVSLARDPAHHWAFWLEAPGVDLTSNVWIHGSDARTIAPRMTEPITACQP